ncbi:DNA cytosine methyltransferase [Bifidobacterium cuniculi]|uniref:Cytosine-specific methyltransferase n=1 Tax=Bifidobacterium cuniculi TaxID=1688 RepID=A0A087B4Z4_9BIFI|nr:DNA cytosine methyltransferase [Bifidobacterium cuniculi]KFI66094.1 modification methylase ScrFIB [Bifidobacterium cuniculi]
MLQILELFGGIGAPRCALRNLGVPVKSIDYVEIDEKAVRSYNKMFEHDLEYRVQDVRGWTLRPDILVHGSPCQDFSIAGHQKGADEGSGTRSSLMWETLRIIRNLGEWMPKAVVWENVPNVLSKHMRHNFDKYLGAMRSLGYVSACDVLNAMDFGLPQDRRRVFTISVLDGAVFDFSKIKRRHPRPIGEFLEHTDEARYKVTQPSMLNRIGEHDGRFNGCVPIIEDHAHTVTTAQMRCPNAGVVPVEDGYRYLTERECWRLQGFTDADYEAALAANPGRPGCMNGALYKQAGNSMPVPVLEAIFEQLEVTK